MTDMTEPIPEHMKRAPDLRILAPEQVAHRLGGSTRSTGDPGVEAAARRGAHEPLGRRVDGARPAGGAAISSLVSVTGSLAELIRVPFPAR
jgi:hypothetical protein